LINELVKELRHLAKNRGITDFDLDLKALESSEGRIEMRKSLEPLNVNHLGVIKKLAAIQSDEILKNMLLVSTQQVVRVYFISGFDFASRDIGGASDPYLKVSVGNKVFDDRKNYQLDEPNPTFHKHFDFESTFPGCPMLTVHAMDHDFLFGDDLIGTTFVDLEDRYFMPEWRAIKNKPVEYRELKHPSSAAP